MMDKFSKLLTGLMNGVGYQYYYGDKKRDMELITRNESLNCGNHEE